jgi:thiamine-phosphate pyrophosphorylase
MRDLTAWMLEAIEATGMDAVMSGKSRDPGIEKMVRWAMRSVARHVRPVRLPTIVLMTDDTLDVDWAEVTGSLPCPVTVIARHRDGTELEKLARTLRLVCRKIGHKLLLSSDPKLAQRLRADGVHLPQALMQRIHDARRRNPNWIVTVSAHDHASVTQASRLGADAIILSPAFATQSHP